MESGKKRRKKNFSINSSIQNVQCAVTDRFSPWILLMMRSELGSVSNTLRNLVHPDGS